MTEQKTGRNIFELSAGAVEWKHENTQKTRKLFNFAKPEFLWIMLKRVVKYFFISEGTKLVVFDENRHWQQNSTSFPSQTVFWLRKISPSIYQHLCNPLQCFIIENINFSHKFLTDDVRFCQVFFRHSRVKCWTETLSSENKFWFYRLRLNLFSTKKLINKN